MNPSQGQPGSTYHQKYIQYIYEIILAIFAIGRISQSLGKFKVKRLSYEKVLLNTQKTGLTVVPIKKKRNFSMGKCKRQDKKQLVSDKENWKKFYSNIILSSNK